MKTEKVGALIYYKHLKILEEAELTDEQIGKIFIAAIKYDETGICPQLPSPLSAFFTMIRYDLDANKEKWESIKTSRSNSGKLGGRPRKTSEPTGESLPLFPDIRNEAKNNGFFIDNAKAQLFCNCGLDPEWFQSPHSFLEFVAGRIAENYGDKPQCEQKALFIDAVKNWEELRDEYPEWKARKEKRESTVTRKAELEAAKDNHPKNCNQCGKDMEYYHGSWICRSCQLQYDFDENTLEWKWRKW